MHILNTLALLACALLLAKTLASVFERIKIPGILGELFAGVLLGNLASYTAVTSFTRLETSETMRTLSEFGALLLLFVVGLETEFRELKKVGADAVLVAVIGVVTPLALVFCALPMFS